MAETRVQNIENHRAKDPGLYIIALCVLLGACFGMAAAFAWNPMIAVLSILLFSVAILGLMLKLRWYALILQDRIIRLEMQMRLERVLPEELKDRAKALTLQQVIALRFASDRELPDLVEKVLLDHITDTTVIKQMVQHWQADWQRV